MKKLPFILITLLILGCIESPKKSEIIEQPSLKIFTVQGKYSSYLSAREAGDLWEANEFLEALYKKGRHYIHQMFDDLFNELRNQSLNESGYVFKGKLEGEEDEYGHREIAETYFSDLIIVDSLYYKEVNKFKYYEKDMKLDNISGVWTTDSYRYNGKPKGAALFRQAVKYLSIKSVRSNVKKYWNLEKPLDTVYLNLPENYYEIK